MDASLSAGANVRVEVHDLDGNLVHAEELHNLVVATGVAELLKALNGEGNALPLDALAVGTGNTAAASTDVALVAQVLKVAPTKRTRTVGKLTLQLFIGSTSCNGVTLNEAGLFGGSVLFARAVITPVAKTSALTVTISWEVNVTAIA